MGFEQRKDDLKQYILDNFEKEELSRLFQELLYDFKDQLEYDLVNILFGVVSAQYQNLYGDFLLLRKNTSENITLNNIYDKKMLEKSRKEGLGYFETRTRKNIIIAGQRFGKDEFPIHMPQTEQILKKIRLNKKDMMKADEEKKSLLRLN